ncbi:MAG: TrmH family RNA methyltransferase [Gammaproteobacteria bacterium]|nr:TrmH family RNA methyltransferase [Gammaproteobacteria bacterium]MBT8133640.1 TrmH family RNA methyltransferase [Gammaproteobacteria bacterium]
MILIADDISDPLNVGGLFRLSDALGIDTLYLCGETPTPPHAKIKKTSRSTEKEVTFEYQADAVAIASALRASGTLIVALEITSSSISINSKAFSQAIKNSRPVCLVLGSENTGVREALLELSDITVHIPMHGANSSMNIVSATAIACFEITRMLEDDDQPA